MILTESGQPLLTEGGDELFLENDVIVIAAVLALVEVTAPVLDVGGISRTSIVLSVADATDVDTVIGAAVVIAGDVLAMSSISSPMLSGHVTVTSGSANSVTSAHPVIASVGPVSLLLEACIAYATVEPATQVPGAVHEQSDGADAITSVGTSVIVGSVCGIVTSYVLVTGKNVVKPRVTSTLTSTVRTSHA